VRFIVDAQLPPALARFIESTGHEADHVIDFGLEAASDRRIWQIAIERSAVIVSKDEDFSRLRSIRSSGPAIVWVRVGNTTRDALLRIFTVRFPQIVAALETGEAVVELKSD
jgi:predicted nuclease of predicted toxin-antitoxin system